jgi:hypothetical protein
MDGNPEIERLESEVWSLFEAAMADVGGDGARQCADALYKYHLECCLPTPLRPSFHWRDADLIDDPETMLGEYRHALRDLLDHADLIETQLREDVEQWRCEHGPTEQPEPSPTP